MRLALVITSFAVTLSACPTPALLCEDTDIDCNDGSICSVSCVQASCTLTCGFGSNCIFSECTNAGCILDCGLQSTCVCDGTVCQPGETQLQRLIR